MDKKLPKVFANTPNKEFNNNERVFYSKEKNFDESDRKSGTIKNSELTRNSGLTKNIYQKINDIFNSERYVYKAEVEIKTTKGNITTKVIGQNKTHLITIDNELIPITDIEDINYVN